MEKRGDFPLTNNARNLSIHRSLVRFHHRAGQNQIAEVQPNRDPVNAVHHLKPDLTSTLVVGANNRRLAHGATTGSQLPVGVLVTLPPADVNLVVLDRTHEHRLLRHHGLADPMSQVQGRAVLAIQVIGQRQG